MKKSLKKLLFILLTLLSIIFIVACGEKASKKEVVEKFVENSKNMLLDAYVIQEEKVEKQKAILEIIE